MCLSVCMHECMNACARACAWMRVAWPKPSVRWQCTYCRSSNMQSPRWYRHPHDSQFQGTRDSRFLGTHDVRCLSPIVVQHGTTEPRRGTATAHSTALWWPTSDKAVGTVCHGQVMACHGTAQCDMGIPVWTCSGVIVDACAHGFFACVRGRLGLAVICLWISPHVCHSCRHWNMIAY